MIRTIVTGPDPKLEQVAREFDFDVDFHIIRDLLDTMRNTGRAMGLAAPQIGYPVRACVVLAKRKRQAIVMLNPSVVSASSLIKRAAEECLSFPGLKVEVLRPASALIEWTTPEGVLKRGAFINQDLRCILHEIDHLNGITIWGIQQARRRRP